jgi:hypothetical protein
MRSSARAAAISPAAPAMSPRPRRRRAAARRGSAAELFFQLAQLAPRRAGAQRDAPADRAAHAAHHVQVVGRAVAGEAGALALPLGHLGQLRAHQVRQRQVLEEDLHELFLAQREDEVVLALAAVAGLPLPLPPPRRPWAARCGRRARTPGCPGAPPRARRPGRGRTPARRCPLGDVDVLAALDVADAAAVDRALTASRICSL